MPNLALAGRINILTRGVINFNTSGNNTIIPADSQGRKIYVHRIWFLVANAVNLTFVDAQPSPAAVPFAANEGLTFDASGEPWFVTAPGAAFIINSNANVQVSGGIGYLLSAL
jgi:hypothetical protein